MLPWRCVAQRLNEIHFGNLFAQKYALPFPWQFLKYHVIKHGLTLIRNSYAKLFHNWWCNIVNFSYAIQYAHLSVVLINAYLMKGIEFEVSWSKIQSSSGFSRFFIWTVFSRFIFSSWITICGHFHFILTFLWGISTISMIVLISVITIPFYFHYKVI